MRILSIRHLIDANMPVVCRGIAKAIKNGVASREELFVVTKLFNDDHRKVEDACRLSLQKLGLDYLDLYLVHW